MVPEILGWWFYPLKAFFAPMEAAVAVGEEVTLTALKEFLKNFSVEMPRV